MTASAASWIRRLDLQPHPEGGYFREHYRSQAVIPLDALPEGFAGPRSASTAIYYLLEAGSFSTFHRIRSDEMWHFYAGDPLSLHVLGEDGRVTHRLGHGDADVLVAVVPAGSWMAAEPCEGSRFGLVGCTVSPGFDFAEFEMADRAGLLARFPGDNDVIARLTRA